VKIKLAFFDQLISARFHADEMKSISNIIKKNKYQYENKSHFFRCAVIKLIREHEFGKQ